PHGALVPAPSRRPAVAVPLLPHLFVVCHRGPAGARFAPRPLALHPPPAALPSVRPQRLRSRAGRRSSFRPCQKGDVAVMFEGPAWLVSQFYSLTHNYAAAIGL